MRDSLDGRLRTAISQRRLIELRYSDRVRVAEPHDYGILNGTAKLLVYQLREKGNDRAEAHGWRMLDVSKIQTCSLLFETFPGSRREDTQRHGVWEQVFARVD